MANHLLSLPYELRDSIWSFASSAGACNGLAGTCRQIQDEFRPVFKFPQTVQELIGLKIWVDSSYINGQWLKLCYTWSEGATTYQQVTMIQDLSDDELHRFLQKIQHITYFEIHLVAPRRGHFVGALLMMLAKVQDAYHIAWSTSPKRRVRRKKKATRIISPFTIVFRTEDSDARPLNSKPFWECRAPKDLRDPTREHDPDWGPSPFFYECFMANLPHYFKTEPRFRFGSWPRPHVSTFGLQAKVTPALLPSRPRPLGRDGLALP
ncbi:hypothetical protein G7Z17_g4674 [Cylindrodendrum hubeiense]|uniref:F-box domain-containing protein n=1 Tax=Cylindrodendrum hubeiense TaxID=595255 RepID=A0A9P5HDK1_9HYPO|nr:hypothetical protein G7Z17_g4674 [Cylindrodendrum hubeiense]